MPWIAYLAHFLAATLVTNSVPHLVHGLCGKAFRTPFVRLNGRGSKVSPPVTNVVWGWVNLMLGFVLFAGVGHLYIGTLGDTVFVAAGILIMGVVLAVIFGRDLR